MIGSVDEDYYKRLAADRGERVTQLTAQVQLLDEVISQCAEAVGAYISPSASIEFKQLLPAEIKKVMIRLSAQPSPDAAQEWVPLSVRLPNPDEHSRVLVYTDGYDFGGEQVFDVAAEKLNECHFSDPDEQPEVCRHASHWAPLKVPAITPPHQEPDAAQGGEHGGEVPQELVEQWWREAVRSTAIPVDGKAAFIAQRAIEWDRQNRAPQPVQKPVAWRLKTDRGWSFTPDRAFAERESKNPHFLWQPLFASPEPVQGDAESVADEERFDNLLIRLSVALYEGGKRGDNEAGVAETEAVRAFFKQSLSHSSKGDEHGK